MADFLTLVCDQCGTVQETPCFGWMHLGKAKKSETMTVPPAKADLCSVECLRAYAERMGTQGNLDEALREADAKVTPLKGTDATQQGADDA